MSPPSWTRTPPRCCNFICTSGGAIWLRRFLATWQSVPMQQVLAIFPAPMREGRGSGLCKFAGDYGITQLVLRSSPVKKQRVFESRLLTGPVAALLVALHWDSLPRRYFAYPLYKGALAGAFYWGCGDYREPAAGKVCSGADARAGHPCERRPFSLSESVPSLSLMHPFSAGNE